MMRITYFVHGTTTDNEAHRASGWNDAGLSEKGVEESHKLRKMVRDRHFDAVFCSDLKRAVSTAKLAFEDRNVPIIQDARLREVDYGGMAGGPSDEIDAQTVRHVINPFPNGESYLYVEKRVMEFLDGAKKGYDGKHIAIVSHRAPQLAIEAITQKKSWQQAIRDDWRSKTPKAWQPGWDYEY